MKSFIFFLFLLFVLNFSTQAQDIAQPAEGGQHRSRHNSTVNPLEFFETLVNPDQFHPDNKRDPIWKEQKLTHLTFEPIERHISKKEFAELLKGTWRNLYHCEGYPILTTYYYGDNKTNGYLEREFSDQTMTRYEHIKKNMRNRRIKFDETKYHIEDLGEGSFKIIYDDFDPQKFTLVRIKESKTVGLIEEKDSNQSCSNTLDNQSLLVRMDVPTI